METLEVKDSLEQNGYELLEQLGEGGFGQCYKVHSNKYNQFFACKAFRISGDKAQSRERSFQTEKDMLCSIIHTNIIHVFQVITTQNYQLLILEYCPNGDLQQYVKKNGPLKSTLLYTYVEQTLEALNFLSENNIAHNDIKPANLLLDQNGRIKLADFGLAQEVEDNQLIAYFLGSPAFLSPEIIKKHPYNPYHSDMWALGVSLYYLATGEFPFPKEDMSLLKQTILCCSYQIPYWVNSSIRTIIHGTLVDNPDKRLTAQDVFQILNKKDEEHSPMFEKQSTMLFARSRRKLVATKSVVGRGLVRGSTIGKPIYTATHPLFVRPKSLPANKFAEYTKMAGL